MSHNEGKSVPVPSVELKPTSQAVRTNKWKSGKNPVLHRPSFSSFSLFVLTSTMGVLGCILQSCPQQSASNHAADESLPNISSLYEKKTMPDLLFFLTFCKKISRTAVAWWGYRLQVRALAVCYRVWQTGSLGSGCWERFGNLFQQPSDTWCILPWPPLAESPVESITSVGSRTGILCSGREFRKQKPCGSGE